MSEYRATIFLAQIGGYPMSRSADDNLYHRLLDLPSDLTEPDLYELLGVPRFTDDIRRIHDAAIARNGQLRRWDNSRYYREADQLTNEVAQASLILEDPVKKAAYDAKLRANSAEIEPIADVVLPEETDKDLPEQPEPPPIRRKSRKKETNESKVPESTASSGRPILVAAGVGGVALLALVILIARGRSSRPSVVAAPPNSSSPANSITTPPTAQASSSAKARLLRTISAAQTISRVALAADGKRLLAVEGASTVRAWDSETGRELPIDQAHIFPPLEIESPTVSFGTDGRFLIVPARPATDFSNTSIPINSCALSRDSQWMLAIQRNGYSIDLLHAESGRHVRGYFDSASPVIQASFSAKGETFYTALASGEIVVRDLKTGLDIRRISGERASNVEFLPEREQALLSFSDGRIKRINLGSEGSSTDLQIKRASGNNLTQTAVTPNGKAVLAILGSGERVLVDIETGNELLTLDASEFSGAAAGGSGIAAIRPPAPVFSADCRRLVTPVGIGSLQVWELPDIPVLQRSASQPMTAADLAFGTKVGQSNPDVPAETANPFQRIRYAATQVPNEFSAIAIGRSGQRGWGVGSSLLTSGAAAGVHRFDLDTGVIDQSTLVGGGLNIVYHCLVVSANEDRLAAASHEGRVAIMDSALKQVPRIISAPESNSTIRSLAFSRDGNLLVVACDRTVGIFNTDTGQSVGRFTRTASATPGLSQPSALPSPVPMGFGPGPMGPMATTNPNTFVAASLSPDSSQLYAIAANGVLTTFDVQSGKKLHEFKCQPLSTAVFSPDATRVAVGLAARQTDDNQQIVSAVIYDVTTGSQLVRLMDSELDLMRGGEFSVDGKWLLTLYSSGRCYRWNTETGQKTGFSPLSDVVAESQAAVGPGGPLGLSPAGPPILEPQGNLPGPSTLSFGTPVPGGLINSDLSTAGLTLLNDQSQFWTTNDSGAMTLWRIPNDSKESASPVEAGVAVLSPRGVLPVSSSAYDVAVSPDATTSIGLTAQGDLIIWKLATLAVERQFKVARQSVSSPLAFASDSKGAAFGAGPQPRFLNLINFNLTNVNDGLQMTAPGAKGTTKASKKKAAESFPSPFQAFGEGPYSDPATHIISLAYCPDGKLLRGHLDGTVTRMDRTGASPRLIDRRSSPVLKVAASRSTPRLMGYDGSAILIWDAITKRPREIPVPLPMPGTINFTHDGKSAALWDQTRREVLFFDLDQGVESRRISLSKGVSGQLPFALSSDGKWMLAASPMKLQKVSQFDSSSAFGSPMNEFDPLSGSAGLVFRGRSGSTKNRKLAAAPPANSNASGIVADLIVEHFDTGAGSTDVKLWSLETASVVAVLRGHTEPVVALALSEDGTTAVTAGLDRVLTWTLPAQ